MEEEKKSGRIDEEPIYIPHSECTLKGESSTMDGLPLPLSESANILAEEIFLSSFAQLDFNGAILQYKTLLTKGLSGLKGTMLEDQLHLILYQKLKMENNAVITQISKTIKDFLDKLILDLSEAISNCQGELKQEKVCNEFFKTYENIIEFKLRRDVSAYFGIENCDFLLEKHLSLVNVMVGQLKRAHLKQIQDEIISTVKWEDMIRTFIDRIYKSDLTPFSDKLIKGDRIELIYSSIIIIACSKTNFSPEEYEYFMQRIQLILASLGEHEEITETLLVTFEDIIRHPSNLSHRKDILEKQRKIFWKILKDKDVEYFVFTVFCICLLLSNAWNDGTLSNYIYAAVDREMARQVITTLHTSKTSCVYKLFFTWEKYCIFEQVLCNFMLQNIYPQPLITPKEEDIQGGALSPLELNNIPELDLLKEFTAKSTLIKIEKVLGENELLYLKSNKLCRLQALTPDRVSRHVTILVSGFMSEDDQHLNKWKGFLETDQNSQLFTLNWASKKMSELKTILLKVSFPIIIGQAAPGFVGKLFQGLGIRDNYMKGLFAEAKKQAKLSGKLLALSLLLRHPFEFQSISLVGFSLGTEVILQCIKQLFKFRAYNIIHDVYLFGGAGNIPDPVKNPELASAWSKMLQIASGRIVNCYYPLDWVLLLYKYTMDGDPIGLRSLSILPDAGGENVISQTRRSIENFNVKKHVIGHFQYRKRFPQILKEISYV